MTVPKELEEIVLACLAKHPSDRPSGHRLFAGSVALRMRKIWEAAGKPGTA